MAQTLYDSAPYRTFPRLETHPDRMGAVAALFGMDPAPVQSCRVLELGCGDGGNLIPMAYALPESRFLGIDLAAEPIAAAQQAATALEIGNVEWRTADLCLLDRTEGQFDYIIAHGLYSWVPAEVRERLLSLCGELLAPHGVAYVSYNAYPGRHLRQMFDGMLRYHTRGVTDPVERVADARAFLESLVEVGHGEAAALLDRSDDTLLHDDLAEINQPYYLHEFAAQAERHGLQYLGDADRLFPPDLIDAQYQDFLELRSFRQTLLCRSAVVLEANPSADTLDRFLFSSDDREILAGALADAYPLPLPFEELEPYGGGHLAETLFRHLQEGTVYPHIYDFPCEETVTAHPTASRLARYQGTASTQVTNMCHRVVELSEDLRQTLLALDGSRRAAEFDSQSLEWLARMALLIA